MKEVRSETPGTVARIRSSNFKKASPCEPRFMRASTVRLACCIGVSRCLSPRACGGQSLRLAHHRFDPAAAKFAAQLRDDAKGAGMVAAFGNFYVRGVTC